MRISEEKIKGSKRLYEEKKMTKNSSKFDERHKAINPRISRNS